MEEGHVEAAEPPSNNKNGGLYVTVENPASTQSQNSFSAQTWIRILSIISIALLVDVVILTTYVFYEPKQTNELLAWAPLPDESQMLTSLTFGSCSNQRLPLLYWDTLLEFIPDLFVMTGDNVYGDCNDTECTVLQTAYDELAAHPSFVGAKSKLAVVATLDDHDYGAPDCHEDNPYKDVAKEKFLDFFDIHDERRSRSNEGVYKSYQYGPIGQRIQLILLDARYHRSPFLESNEKGAPGKEVYMEDKKHTHKKMLSDMQWKWLEGELAVPDINVRLVVSSIQVLAEGHGYECWRMIPHERTRLIDTLKTAAGKTFIISGDRHVGGFYELDGIVEMTASSLSHTIPIGGYNCGSTAAECDEKDPLRLDDFVRVNQFGSVEMDWKNRIVILALRRIDPTMQYYYSHKKGNNANQKIQNHSYSIP